MINQPIIAVIGLGYVGYPLALALGKYYKTIGFDIDQTRIQELQQHKDRTCEADTAAIAQATFLSLISNPGTLGEANLYIVTTSTPVTASNQPDLSEVLGAAETVGQHLSPGDRVILESTVYPGVTEGVFADTIERVSKLVAGTDFYLGYSPERINPGDPLHRLQNIVKVVSASDESTLELMADVYGRIVPEGIHRAASIKTAELSKLIENTQRDVNIAFVNEMYQLSDAMELDFNQVMACANTKWNFLDFKPGLVGGHCVAVDPYYLLHQQNQMRLPAGVTLMARQTNEQMVGYVVGAFIKKLTKAGLSFSCAQVLVIGSSFKPDCPDLRNSKALRVVQELMEYGLKPDIYDPVIKSPLAIEAEFFSEIPEKTYDAVLMLVPHKAAINALANHPGPLLKPGGIFSSLDASYEALVA
ncbi:nucleotide sugar dehydrogenase [Endozoicomonas atrinae]|uniref:nucleotide sugar dehydrogenase n=1 Tax=Endozoicomonas atrinae TaxID=1333660 RepID=UPI0008240BE8|nr:nucleotide sugar dehydrogenase [Endozoicomonas atrinae]